MFFIRNGPQSIAIQDGVAIAPVGIGYKAKQSIQVQLWSAEVD